MIDAVRGRSSVVAQTVSLATSSQPNVIVNTPNISTVVTTVAPPSALPNPEVAAYRNASPAEEKDVGITRVPYPVSSSALSVTKDVARAAYAYQPGKTYRSKRVFKVIILGDAGVGKTCLSFRFCNGRFPAQTEATIGVDFRERSVVIEGELIRVQLWDTAGQERYRQSIVSHYYRNVNAVVFVYDVNSLISFRSLAEWISECRRHAVCSDGTPHILVGNKCDLQSETRIKTDIAQIFADQNDMALFETSALAESEADHVESIFMTLVHKLQQSKPMHVQSDEERARNEQRLLLKASKTAEMESEGWCC